MKRFFLLFLLLGGGFALYRYLKSRGATEYELGEPPL